MKKITVLALVLVLCLAALGIGYAKWTDQINLTGTVTTGSVDLNIVDYSGTWVWKVPSADCELVITHDPDYEPNEGWLIAWSYAECAGEDAANLVFSNIFPDIEFMADVLFRYDGTIPAKVSSIACDFEGDTELLQYATVAAYRTDSTGNEVGEAVGIGTQLHDGDYVKLVVTIKLPENNDLMNLSLSGTCTITVAQWAPCEELPNGEIQA